MAVRGAGTGRGWRAGQCVGREERAAVLGGVEGRAETCGAGQACRVVVD